MSDKDYLNLYRTIIAERYMLGTPNGRWRQRDFEALAIIIEDKSGVKISLSTLKRLWRSDFSQTPHPSTLDALASLVDAKDWLHFKTDFKPSIPEETPTKRFWFIGVVLVAALILVGFLVIGPETNPKPSSETQIPVATGPVKFTANKTIATGVPNTVIFKYDVSNLQADHFYLQQSWNEKHRVSIDPMAGNYSSTYYTPGFHRAKLLANDSIFKTTRIHIKTDGWLPLVKYDRTDLVPIYIRDLSFAGKGQLFVTPEKLKQAGVNIKNNFILNYHNVREFNGLESSNLHFRTRLRLDSIGNYACPQLSVTLVCEEGIFYVPLTTLGCVGNIGVKFAEVVKSGNNSDLSAFGINNYEWQELQINVKDKNAKVMLNGANIFNTTYHTDYGLLMGLVISFTGSGSIDYVEVLDPQGNHILNDNFL